MTPAHDAGEVVRELPKLRTSCECFYNDGCLQLGCPRRWIQIRAGELNARIIDKTVVEAERDALRARVEELTASNEKLHRRAQRAEGPLDAVKQQLINLTKHYVDSWHFEFKRYLSANERARGAEELLGIYAREHAALGADDGK